MMKHRQSDVVVAGIGQTPVGEHWEISLRSLAAEAILNALKDAGGLRPKTLYISNLLAATASRQANLGSLIAEDVGLTGAEGVTVEAADASGGAALRMAYLAVCSGAVDVAMAVGVEKSTDVIGSEGDSVWAQTLEADFEAAQGLTPQALAAMLMQRYLYTYQPEREVFGGFSKTAHENAVTNPNAMFRKQIRPGAYEQSLGGEEVFSMYDLAPLADGAAALVVARVDALSSGWDRPLVQILGSSLVVDTLALHDRRDSLGWEAARLSVERARDQAGISLRDVDFFEYHDATSLHAVLSLEAAGFTEKGMGWQMASPEEIGLNGKLPVATFGGLKARGNPLGATGIYQAVEATLQLRGQAGENQVSGAQIGLIQSLGGLASTAVTHIFSS